MNQGMYLSAGGALTASYRMDVLANNLANAQTTGFQAYMPVVAHRDPAVQEQGLSPSRRHLLDQLGGGLMMGPRELRLSLGEMEVTGRPLDVALTDAHHFLVVQDTDPNGQTASRLTRNGRLTVNNDGQLTTTTGRPVMDERGGPMVVPMNTSISIDPSGAVRTAEGEVVGRLQVVEVESGAELRKLGDSLLAADGGYTTVTNPVLETGHIENSSVDPIKTLMDLISANKSIAGNGRMITYHDQLMDQAINTFGRVG